MTLNLLPSRPNTRLIKVKSQTQRPWRMVRDAVCQTCLHFLILASGTGKFNGVTIKERHVGWFRSEWKGKSRFYDVCLLVWWFADSVVTFSESDFSFYSEETFFFQLPLSSALVLRSFRKLWPPSVWSPEGKPSSAPTQWTKLRMSETPCPRLCTDASSAG